MDEEADIEQSWMDHSDVIDCCLARIVYLIVSSYYSYIPIEDFHFIDLNFHLKRLRTATALCRLKLVIPIPNRTIFDVWCSDPLKVTSSYVHDFPA